MLNFLIGSPNWDTRSKIVCIFGDSLPLSPTLPMNFLNSFIQVGIFNVGILQPGTPCQLITSEPFSDQLRVTEDPGVVDPKHGKWHYNLHGHHLTILYPDTALDKAQNKASYKLVMDRLLSHWNATSTYQDLGRNIVLTDFLSWNRSQVVSQYYFMLFTTEFMEILGWTTDKTKVSYEPRLSYKLLLTANESPDDLYFIYELFLNRHSLALFSVFVLGNILYLIYTRCRGGARNRTSVVKHFLDTLPLCSLQSMNFNADTPTKRTFFVGFVTTVFFLSSIYNCHITSRLIDLNLQMQIETVQDVVDRKIPIVMDEFHKVAFEMILYQELGLEDVDDLIIVTNNFEFENISSPTVAHLFYELQDYNIEIPNHGYSAKWIPLGNWSYLIGFIFPQHSPYFEDFRTIRMAYAEGGFQKSMHAMNKHLAMVKDVDELNRGKYGSLQSNQFFIAIKILLAMLFESFLVFLWEVFHKRLTARISLVRNRCG